MISTREGSDVIMMWGCAVGGVDKGRGMLDVGRPVAFCTGGYVFSLQYRLPFQTHS